MKIKLKKRTVLPGEGKMLAVGTVVEVESDLGKKMLLDGSAEPARMEAPAKEVLLKETPKKKGGDN